VLDRMQHKSRITKKSVTASSKTPHAFGSRQANFRNQTVADTARPNPQIHPYDAHAAKVCDFILWPLLSGVRLYDAEFMRRTPDTIQD